MRIEICERCVGPSETSPNLSVEEDIWFSWYCTFYIKQYCSGLTSSCSEHASRLPLALLNSRREEVGIAWLLQQQGFLPWELVRGAYLLSQGRLWPAIGDTNQQDLCCQSSYLNGRDQCFDTSAVPLTNHSHFAEIRVCWFSQMVLWKSKVFGLHFEQMPDAGRWDDPEEIQR